MTTPYYNRAPSPHLQELLMPGGPLSWLVELNERKISGRAFDVHFRSRRRGSRLPRRDKTPQGGEAQMAQGLCDANGK